MGGVAAKDQIDALYRGVCSLMSVPDEIIHVLATIATLNRFDELNASAQQIAKLVKCNI